MRRTDCTARDHSLHESPQTAQLVTTVSTDGTGRDHSIHTVPAPVCTRLSVCWGEFHPYSCHSLLFLGEFHTYSYTLSCSLETSTRTHTTLSCSLETSTRTSTTLSCSLVSSTRTHTLVVPFSCGTSHASAVSTPLRWIFKNAICASGWLEKGEGVLQ